ncbi:MAG: ribosomal protein large subunit ribosomal protein [Candidatus Parcubacteria bacterium]|jgi:large subunit ribosomal protein L24
MKIKKGDKVIVLAGKDKGKTGEVVRSLPKENKVIVSGVNIAKKHTRNRFNTDKKGEIVDKTMPINVSNVALIDSKNKPTRVGYKVVGTEKVRVAKKSGQEIK